LSLTIREEYHLKVFRNRLVRKICGPKVTEVTGDYRKLCNESFTICNYWPNTWLIKSTRMSWVWYVACMEEEKYIQDFGGET
jgi:hypothetical protein